MRVRRKIVSLAVVAAVFALSACGDSGGSTADSSATTGPGATTAATTTVPPKVGGSMTFGLFAATTSLDPAGTLFSSGGIEGAALYDELMKYDSKTGGYVPQLAESLTPNADFTVWTLKLRPNVKFTDGTPLNADAVVFNLKRQVEKKSRSSSLLTLVKDYQTPDATTVIITLSSPWSGFPYALTSSPGNIASPTAIAAQGDSFATNPVGGGAGPFMLSSFKAGEALILKRNPNYWAGPAYLDEVKFVLIPGASATYDALKTKTLQAAYLRDAAVNARAKADGFTGYDNVLFAGDTMIFNNGVTVACKGGAPAPICTGIPDGQMVPTKSIMTDKRVRQAVAAAIDMTQMNARIWDGKADLTSDLFSQKSRWYTVPGPKYDLDAAKKLVAQVKAEGTWDGTVRVACDGSLPAWSITVKTLLDAAGFKATVVDLPDVATRITQIQVKRDYDIACYGTAIADSEPLYAMNREFNSSFIGGAGNPTGYNNPAVDNALKQAYAAKNDADKKAAIEIIAKAYAADVPLLSLGVTTEFITWANNVHGVEPLSMNIVSLAKAWLD